MRCPSLSATRCYRRRSGSERQGDVSAITIEPFSDYNLSAMPYTFFDLAYTPDARPVHGRVPLSNATVSSCRMGSHGAVGPFV